MGLMLGCQVALMLIVSGFWIKAEAQVAKPPKTAITTDQVITSIRTATAAKPGKVFAVDVENEANKIICLVSIIAQDGKAYDVEVDVATNKVMKIDEANDDMDNEDDDDE
jgi:uncharacterized membrane protein YkoI